MGSRGEWLPPVRDKYFVYAAKDEKRNSAVVLKEYLQEKAS